MVAGTTSSVFLNEFHYDNAGGDVGEFIEIANTAGTDLTGWSVVLYNGSNGATYNTLALSGSDALILLNLPSNGLQNGSPDAIAIVDADGNVVQFLSYEGSLTATNGPASGLTSTDIGVSESSSTAIGNSLQLTGTGSLAGDFTWQAPAAETPGAANNGQTFAAAAPVLFINEFHYDNTGGDVGEFIEVAGTAGLDLSGYSLVLYNGSNGTAYNTINLAGTVDDEGAGFGAVDFQLPSNGLQNGSPDGIALVDPDGGLLQFLSYEGSFTAVGGPADGVTSTDVGVAETSSTPIGQSLQLTGNGNEADDFTWTGPAAQSAGSLNAGQTFGTVVVPQPGALSIEDAENVEGDGDTNEISFIVSRSGGSDGAVSADYTITFDGSADASDLIAPLTGTVNFADGETEATITVTIDGDTDIEPNETFSVTLDNPQGGVTIDVASAQGTIIDDDTPVGPAQVFVNEVHYDNAGGDTGEAIEVAGPAGTDLSGWQLVLYNGNGGNPYNTVDLAGIIPDQDNGFGTVSFAISGIQNGSPDGFALVDPAGNVVQFLSYEGTIEAQSGPAIGMVSTDIGVSENGGTPAGFSVQLAGVGTVADDFVWQSPTDDSFGAVNSGQSFIAPNPNGSFFLGDASVVEGDSGTSLITFPVFRVGGTEGAVSATFDVEFGDGFQDADASDFTGAISGTVEFADGETFTTITLEVTGDEIPEPNEFFNVTLSNPTGGADISAGVGQGEIINDDPLNLQIGEIQGAGHTSPFVGNEVTTTGIVTAVASNGFYFQDPDGDGDSATSDGIFVFTGGTPTVVVGDGLTVTGTVGEFQPAGDPGNLTITQLSDADILVDSVGNALPEAVVIGPDGITPPTETIEDDNFTSFDPETDGIDFWESLEGQLVTIQNPVAVDSTNRFGELFTAASDGAGNLSASNVSDEGLLVIDGGEGGLGEFDAGAGSDFNPERIQIDNAGSINGEDFDIPDVTPGTLLNDVTGVVDYAFENFQVRPTGEVTVAAQSTNVAEQTSLVGSANQLSLATYNVLNLDINDADGDDDVASGRFDAVAFDIGVNLQAPDIVVLQEIQDDSGSINDGTISAQMTLEALAQSIFDQSGIQYSVFDNPFAVDGETGGQPGGNIRVAFLYREDRVDLDEASVFTITNPDDGELNAAFGNSRAPLGATFTFNGENITVIGNHFTSKIGSNSTFSAVQPPANANALARAAQAAAVNEFVDGLLAADADANIAVVGDFNEFQFEEPMEVLSGELDFDGGQVSEGGEAVLQNLTQDLDANDRFSVLFQGNAQQLDHIFASDSLASGAQIDAVHTNTPTGSITSDHDPILALFNLGVEETNGGRGDDTIEGNDGNDDISGGNGDDELIGNGGDDELNGGNGDDTLSGGEGDDTLIGGNGEDILDGGADNDILEGGNRNDILRGGEGDDQLSGGNGNDVIDGGAGADILRGGNGADQFVLDASGSAEDADTIVDFSARRRDELQIENADGANISFVEDGRDTQILADGVLIATVQRADPSDVRDATTFNGNPASIEVVEADPPIRGRAFDFMSTDSFDFADFWQPTRAMEFQRTAEVESVRTQLESVFESASASSLAEPIDRGLDQEGNSWSNAAMIQIDPLF